MLIQFKTTHQTPLKTRFGQHIQYLKEMAGLHPESEFRPAPDLLRAMGCSPRRFYMIIEGRTEPLLREAWAFCEHFKLDIRDMVKTEQGIAA